MVVLMSHCWGSHLVEMAEWNVDPLLLHSRRDWWQTPGHYRAWVWQLNMTTNSGSGSWAKPCTVDKSRANRAENGTWWAFRELFIFSLDKLKAIFLFNMIKSYVQGSSRSGKEGFAHAVQLWKDVEKSDEGKILAKYTDNEPILVQKVP